MYDRHIWRTTRKQFSVAYKALASISLTNKKKLTITPSTSIHSSFNQN